MAFILKLTFTGIAAQEGHEECVRLLLSVGANPHHSDHCGRNALKVAAKSGHLTVVKLLEEAQANGENLGYAEVAFYYFNSWEAEA